ncbi:hypothetical protein BKP56_11105 [Marinilactibacillus sp. 15R]|uniref:Uncharacterized protein n=1 Tax=Marinilactibacillus piezotolerans TaxID=258723 RepID=A0A1I3WU52_9LACT|nr:MULTISPECIES: hypothetical protein [Marinilactibacillus]API89773.1 hypothetical protein BKP56_11105 [Marinilactibacillus sp. 15R]SFK11055.1 hypothetical protein SAMN04488569_101032 [Marinilactibacillus piezotolerans]
MSDIKVKLDKKEVPKGMTLMESKLLSERLSHKIPYSTGRKRPRNFSEKKTLLRWEKERNGKKIGHI